MVLTVCVQGRRSAGAGPDSGHQRNAPGGGHQPAAGPRSPATAQRTGGAGRGPRPPTEAITGAGRQQRHQDGESLSPGFTCK